MFTKSFKIYTNWQVFVSPADPGGGAAVVGGQKHPTGSKTVLMKIEFYKKMCVLPQRGNHLCHLKSGKFGRPNLGVFWGNCVFATVKHNFLLYFDRTNSGILFSTRSLATSLQSSQAASCTYWWSAIATFWHITWRSRDLCSVATCNVARIPEISAA